jgi:hypothetical protein
MQRFPIGFWNIGTMCEFSLGQVDDWADCGMTLAMSPAYHPDTDDPAAMRALLDAAAAREIAVILQDHRALWHRLTEGGEAAYRQGFLAAVADFGAHPATLGFYVGDEPMQATFADACRAQRLQREWAPALTPFLNLLPWVDDDNVNTHHVGTTDWPAYLETYVAEANPTLLSYDCYSHMKPGGVGLEMYFRNLRYYQEASARHGLPFWYIPLSCGHFTYRCPTEDDFRWQLNTAAAHGAKGILWFFFQLFAPMGNFRLAPVDTYGERTETFTWLRRQQRAFLDCPAPVLLGCTLERVQHVGTAWGGFPLFDGSGRVAEATADQPLILSEFRNADGRPYLAVVNASQTDSTRMSLRIRGNYPTAYRVEWRDSERLVHGTTARNDYQTDDTVIVGGWLAPGQMELFRVEEG